LPGTLMAVVVATLAANLLGLPIQYVDVPGDILGSLQLTAPSEVQSLGTGSALITVFALALIASAETLLCASAVDRMHSGPASNYDRELVAQGVGNLVCGLLGALPMTGVIVRSSANVDAGGKTRLSAILHGLWLLALVGSAPFVLELIPTASLAAVLVYTGFKLMNPANVRALAKKGYGELVVYGGTVVVIVSFNLLAGVMVGLLIALGKLLHTFSHLKVRVDKRPGRVDVGFTGAATFLRLPVVARTLEAIEPAQEVHLHIGRLNYVDHACMELIESWRTKYEKADGAVRVEWNDLEKRNQAPIVRLERSRQSSPSPETVPKPT
jgi:MFS superfamily sulfate permease-like transporter